MSTMYDDEKVKCPFYVRREEKKIVCEGLQDKCNLSQGFNTSSKMREYKESYCDNHYESCEIYQMLKKKY